MVGHWLEGLLLTHAEADLLLGFVSEQLCVSNASLFPLVVVESVELGPVLPQTLQLLLSSLLLNFLQSHLHIKVSQHQTKHTKIEHQAR